jgi:hypothetical protein
MRIVKVLVSLFLLALFCLPDNPANSQVVVDFFTAPGDDATWGLTWDGQSLWSASVAPDDNVIYRLDTLGNVISSFFWDKGIVSGMTWDGQYLWLSENSTGNIYQVTTTGNLIQQLTTPLGDVAGLAWDGGHLWVIDRNSETVNKVDSVGGLIDSFPAPISGGNPSGLTWGGNSLWFCNPDSNRIFQLSNIGNVLQEFVGPGLAATELAWDGYHLWLSDIVTDRIYKLKVPTVQPAVRARVEFPGGHWPLAWKSKGKGRDCDATVQVDIDSEDLFYWDNSYSDQYLEKLACRKRVNCFLGNLHSDTVKYDVGQILVETVRINGTVEVMKKKDCDSQMNMSASTRPISGEACYDTKIYSHLDRFEGRVLRLRFDVFEIFKTLGTVGGKDTVEVCLTGELKNGLEFSSCTQIVIVGDRPTFVSPDGNAALPKQPSLLGNFPNPFNASTVIRFELPQPMPVELTVYNLLGQRVKTLARRTMPAGQIQVTWDGTDQNGSEVGTGIYFYQLVTAGERETKKMVLLK